MSVRGSTRTVALVDLLSLIQGNGHAGTLKVEVGERATKLHFFRGQIYLPTGGSRGAYRIGALLVRAGKLTGKDLLRALALQKGEGHKERLGDLLVRQGMVTRADLDQVIRAQFEEELSDLLFEQDADFEFRKDVLPAGFADAKGNIQALGFDTRSVLMEASRRQDEWRRIRAAIPSTRVVLRPAVVASGAWHVDPKGNVTSDVQKVAPQQDEVLEQIRARWRAAGALFEDNPFDGVRSVEEVAQAAGLPLFQALGVVAALRQDGLVRELAVPELELGVVTQLRDQRPRTAYKLYEWANESEKLRDAAGRLDKLVLRPEHLDGQSFVTRTTSVRALQILSRLLRREAPFRYRAREGDAMVEVFHLGNTLRLHLVGPRRTHSTTRYLRRRGAVTGAQVEEARRVAEETKRRLDRVLLDDGFVAREDWVRAVKDKVVSGLFSVFGWAEPEVEVQGGEVSPPPPGSVHGLVCEIPLDVGLRESLRRDLLRWKALLRVIPTPEVVFIVARPTPEGRPRRAHDLFDGRRTVRDLIALARVAPLELVRFVYDCAKSGRIRPLNDREHYERLEAWRQASRLDDAITICKSAIALGYAPKLYRERLDELRAQLKSRAPKATEARPVLQGDAKSLSLAETLQLLRQGKCTGTLRITDGERDKVFFLDDGVLHVLKVESSEADREVWDLIMGDETHHSLDLGDLLKRRGHVTEQEVGAAELESIKDDIFEAFLWEGATFEFVQNLLPSEMREDTGRATKLALDTDRLLIQAMTRLAEWDDLRTVLKSDKAVFRYASPRAQLEAVQTAEVGALAYLFDGKHALNDVVRISGENRFKVYRRVRGLVDRGLLVLAPDAPRPSAPVKRPRKALASGRIPRLEEPTGTLVPGAGAGPAARPGGPPGPTARPGAPGGRGARPGAPGAAPGRAGAKPAARPGAGRPAAGPPPARAPRGFTETDHDADLWGDLGDSIADDDELPAYRGGQGE